MLVAREMLKQQELRQAEERRELKEGIDEAVVRRMLGPPYKINRTVLHRGETRDQ